MKFLRWDGQYAVVTENGGERFVHKTDLPKDVLEANPHPQKRGKPITPEKQDEILSPYEFEIEETYREEGQRAGDRLVASILRQAGFEPTSAKEQESTRQAIENERAGGTTAEAEMNELAAHEAAERERSIAADLASMEASANFGVVFSDGMADPTEAFWEQWRRSRREIDALGWRVDKVPSKFLGSTGPAQWKLFESREAQKAFYTERRQGND